LVDSPAHQGDFVIDVLEQIHVHEVLDPNRKIDLVPEDMVLPDILSLVASSRNTYFPVIDPEKNMTSIFSLRDLRSALTGDHSAHLILAADIASTPVLTVIPEDDLHTALRRFTKKNIDDIPVVDPENHKKILGMLSRKHLIAAYHDRITELRNPSLDPADSEELT
jgi:CIC family chloride channel protein